MLGEFHRVAEDLDSLLLITESTCFGRLTADKEHLPAGRREGDTGHRAAAAPGDELGEPCHKGRGSGHSREEVSPAKTERGAKAWHVTTT